MADYTSESITVQRRRFILHGPSNLTEFDKMVTAAMNKWRQDFPAVNFSDDAISVSTEDGAIVFSWEVRS